MTRRLALIACALLLSGCHLFVSTTAISLTKDNLSANKGYMRTLDPGTPAFKVAAMNHDNWAVLLFNLDGTWPEPGTFERLGLTSTGEPPAER